MEDTMIEAPILGDPADTAMLDADIDDLFGEPADALDGNGLVVPIPSAPPPSELVMRIADMQVRGCCTKLAWSSAGSLARITDDGREIRFRAMAFNQKLGEWALTEDSDSPIVAPVGTIWEHIQFNGVGIDLCAIDSEGAAHVYSLVATLGRMLAAPMNEVPEDAIRSELDAVVGLYWLPMYPSEFKVPLISPATKVGDRWNTVWRQRDASEPSVHHPADNRSAFVHISRSAKLTLVYQNENAWHSVSAVLEGEETSIDVLSHAAINQEGDHLVALVHDMAKRFRMYRVTIRWNEVRHTRSTGQQQIVVAPALEIEKLSSIAHVAPQQAVNASLSELQIVHALEHGNDHGNTQPLTILAVFTRATLPTGLIQQDQEIFSVISRWHVEHHRPILHQSFSTLKSSSAQQPQSTVTTLRRQEDIITNKLILGIDSQYQSTLLLFTASDGSVEFRDRLTMTSIEPYGDTLTVSSLPQSGFEHIMGDHHVHAVISADASAVACVGTDGQVSSKLMSLRYSWTPFEDGMSDSKGLIEAAVVCLARQYAILLYSSSANDENLALMPRDLSTDMRVLFVKEIVRIMNRNLDIALVEASKQPVTVLKETLLPRALSAQLVMNTSFDGQSINRATSGNFAHAFLQIRQVCQSIAPLVSRPDHFTRPGYVHDLRGLVRWGLEMLVYVMRTVMDLEREAQSWSNIFTVERFEVFIADERNPCLHLALSVFTRAHMRFLAGNIPRYLASVHKVLPHARSTLEKQHLVEILEIAASLPFKLGDFEAFMADVDNSIRVMHLSTGTSSERRADLELSLLTESTFPPEILPVLQTITQRAAPKVMAKADLSRLYFWDVSWLGCSFGPTTYPEYDTIRKTRLSNSCKLRVCRRCGSVMEDLSQEQVRALPPWLSHAQRHCVCGDYWIAK